MDTIEYIGTYSLDSPVLYIAYSIDARIYNCKISMSTQWLFIASLNSLKMENIEMYGSETQGSMIFASTVKDVYFNNGNFTNISATCLHLQDISTVLHSEKCNVV